MAIITLEQAKIGARRSVEARRERAAELLRLREQVTDLQTKLAAFAVKPEPEPKQALPELATRTREHLDAIDKLLAKCQDHKEWDALTRSREREWRILAHLANIPGPGNMKPVSPRSRSTQAPPRPQPVVVEEPEKPNGI